MNVLLVGNGAREHCIAEALTRSGRVSVYAYGKAKNPGILQLAQHYRQGALNAIQSVVEYANEVKPDFAVIGPDDPIADGVADALLELGIHSVAPLRTVARLESSKSFTRDLVEKYQIPGNPKFKVFYDTKGLADYIRELDVAMGGFVIKADGLTGGKGVKVSGDHLASVEEGEAYARECLEKSGRVVVEEKFIGQEFSLMSFVDGRNVSDMPPVQDHKRAFEGDRGPNTGGMGSYSDANHLLPFLTRKDVEDAHEITVRVAQALFEETGVLFKGIMYGGFIAVKDGVRLIEYNARFGDPEVMNVLPILKTDFVEICEAILAGRLHQLKIEYENKATVCKYVVPEGYPDKPKFGEKIEIDGSKIPDGVKMYYSSVDQRDDGLYLSASRAVAFVGIADTLPVAEQAAEQAVNAVKGPVFHRADIGTEGLIRKKISHMKQVRGH
ncbi:MAG: phosphoribosylamine--glycine ligase [Patescibacteria group bacterium]|mgnify:CR=1 FL=1